MSKRITSKQVYGPARKILGRAFISPKEVASAHNITYGADQLKILMDTIPDAKILQWLRDHSHILVPGPSEPKSLLDIHSLQPDLFQNHENNHNKNSWYDEEDEKFSRNDKAEMRWLTLCSAPDFLDWTLDMTCDETCDEQQKHLNDTGYYILNAGETSWCVTTYYLVRGIHFSPHITFYTSSVTSEGRHVRIGFDEHGLFLNDWFPSFLAISRQLT